MTRKVNARMSNKERIHSIANEMVEVFDKHSSKVAVGVKEEIVDGVIEAYASDEGLALMSDIFGRAPIELRAATYEVFLDLLTERGFVYSIDQFKGPVH